jgi:hypothetical protein
MRLFKHPLLFLLHELVSGLPQGDSASYMRIVNEVMSGNSETLSKVFVGLTPCVTTLAKAPHEFKELVNAIFGVSTSVWAVLADVSSVDAVNKDAAASPGPVREALCDAFAEFVAQLVSANACFLLPALQALIRCFRTIDCVSISVLDSSAKVRFIASCCSLCKPWRPGWPIPTDITTMIDTLHHRLLPIPWGTQVLELWLSVLCMRSKAWLAARVSLRLARMPCTAMIALHSAHVAFAPRLRQSFSRTLRSQKHNTFFNGSKT